MKKLETYKTLATQFYEYEKITQDASDEIAFYDAYAHSAGGPILEPMCGSGRILLPLLQRGYAIEGFDASEAMLAVLRQKYAMITSAPAPVWQQYLQDFVAQKQYALIIIPFGSFGLILEREHALQSLHALRAALAPGGILLLEIDTRHSVTSSDRGLRMRLVQCDDGSLIRLQAHISYNDQSQIYQSLSLYERLRHGVIVESEREQFRQYIYADAEFELLLARAGFTQVIRYSLQEGRTIESAQAPQYLYECMCE
jgi:SAM-dependent methyltransferase